MNAHSYISAVIRDYIDMNTDWLNDYITLIEAGSFSAAAERRLMNHTSLARRNQKLEDWAGSALIERTLPIKPTAAGLIFLEAAKDIDARLLQIRSQLADTTLHTEALRIATGRTLASEFFPSWYTKIHKAMPFVHMSVLSGGSEYAAARFANQQADLLLAYQTPMIELILAKISYDQQLLGQELIVPVTHQKDHFDIIQKLNSHAHLHKVRWLNYDQSLSLKSVVVSHLSKQKLLPNLHPVFESDNYETLKAMIMQGVGIAWLPYSVVRHDTVNKRLFIIGDKRLQISVNIALYKHTHHKGAALLQTWDTSAALYGKIG